MKKENITVYTPNQRLKLGFFKIWYHMLRNILASQDLITQLFKRDFIGQYKKSFLGLTWILLAPLVGIISWVFMNSVGLFNPGDVGIPYPAYVLLGTTIWGLFVGFYDSASKTLEAGAQFIMQVSYPHEALLVQQIAHFLAGFILSFLLTIVVLLIFGVVPHWKIVFFPLLMIPLLFLGAAIGLVASVFSVLAMDVKKVFLVFLQLAMFITPVVYSPKFDNPLLQTILKWNPLTYLISGTRDIIIKGTMENWTGYMLASLFAFVAFMISWRLFFVSEDKVIEKMI
ncbi:MAG: ABC transporter permease [bacterium]|nr:ABC transporter permease [bacterium]